MPVTLRKYTRQTDRQSHCSGCRGPCYGRWLDVIAALLIASVASGCAAPRSTGEYLRLRGRDLSHCVRGAVGVGYGAHVKIHTWLPMLPVGIGYSHTQEVGWDGGTGIGRFTWHRYSATVPYVIMGCMDWEILSSQEFHGGFSEFPEGVDFVRHGVFAVSQIDIRHETSESIPSRRAEANMFWLGFDATLGLVSVRLGVRPHEILDACLGLFCIDICGDDGVDQPDEERPSAIIGDYWGQSPISA